MSTAAKLLVAVLLLAAIAGAAFLFLQPDDPAAPPSGPTPSVQQPVQPAQPAAPEVVANPIVDSEPVRVSATGSAADSHQDLPQGVRGHVLLPNGAPAAGAMVMLLEGAGNDPLAIFLKNRTGEITAPLATGTVGNDGTFALGVRRAGKVDLRVVTDNYPTVSKQPIEVRDRQWYEAGDIRLEPGLVVQGRVVDAVTKMPVPGATVYLASSHQAHQMMATPGRERGAPAGVDGAGFFRFQNGPRIGLVNLTAEAPGYASGTLLNQQLKPDVANEFTLEVEPGRQVRGVVVDQDGKRISGAKVQAQGLSAKTPQNESVFADAAGEFVFESLRAGPYQLTTSAPRFADKVQMALTGEDVKVVMTARGSVKLKVLAANGRPVKSYRISLKRSFPNNPVNIGNVLDFPDRNVGPADYPREFGGEWALIQNMPGGETAFRFQISESQHAKSLSPEFTIVEGADPVEVVATLTLGAGITGVVVDEQGRPVSGATVTSDMNSNIGGIAELFEVFRAMMPEKHTSRQATTDAQGRFQLNQLSFADYMVRVSHPRFCEGSAFNIKLTDEGQIVDAGLIELRLGALIEGLVLADGLPAGQVKVKLARPVQQAGNGLPVAQPGKPQTPEQQQEQMAAAAKAFFSATGNTDGSGRYRLLQRVPPGTYTITAARHNPNDPFGAMMDMKMTETQLVIAPGQDQAVVNFTLPSR